MPRTPEAEYTRLSRAGDNASYNALDLAFADAMTLAGSCLDEIYGVPPGTHALACGPKESRPVVGVIAGDGGDDDLALAPERIGS